MSYYEDEYTTVSYELTCPKCQKKMSVRETDQTPGFRERDYLRCCWCHETLESSREVEYFVSPVRTITVQ